MDVGNWVNDILKTTYGFLDEVDGFRITGG